MTDWTKHFDALSAALFGGPIKAADIKVVFGEMRADREKLSDVLLASMNRMGIIRDGLLVNLNNVGGLTRERFDG